MTAYEQLVAQLAELRPRTAAALGDAEQRRQEQLRTYLGGARLAAVEELLVHLDALATAWEADTALTTLAFLPARLADDFETAVEATLSGYLAVAADAMRDVMEIENLLWDFSSEPPLVEQWLTADARTLRRQFSADAVRKRLHKAGVGRYRTSAEAGDYRAHSASLHVTPSSHRSTVTTKGRVSTASFEGDVGFWEVFEHARRLGVALARASETMADQPHAIPRSDLPAVDGAWQRTQELQTAYLELLRQHYGETPT